MKVTDGNSNEVDYLLTLNNGAWNSQTDYYNYVSGSLSHILSTATNYNFTNSCPQSICGGPNGAQWITASSTTTTLSDTGQSTQTQYVYNHPQYGKPDKVKVWNYSTPCELRRKQYSHKRNRLHLRVLCKWRSLCHRSRSARLQWKPGCGRKDNLHL